MDLQAAPSIEKTSIVNPMEAKPSPVQVSRRNFTEQIQRDHSTVFQEAQLDIEKNGEEGVNVGARRLVSIQSILTE